MSHTHTHTKAAPDTVTAAEDDVEYLTVVSRDPSPAALAFHRQRLGGQGYAITGRIEKHHFQFVGADGKAETLFSGEPFYAATFVRRIARADA